MIFRRRGIEASAVLVVIGVMTVGCNKKTTVGPPKVHYGEDVCATCGMIISDQRFAGAIVSHDEDGDRQSFLYDDIGGMIADVAARSTGADDEFFVHDYLSGEWIDAERGFFARSDALSTPMAWGIAAFLSRADAQDMVGRLSGELLTWDELRSISDNETEPNTSD